MIKFRFLALLPWHLLLLLALGRPPFLSLSFFHRFVSAFQDKVIDTPYKNLYKILDKNFTKFVDWALDELEGKKSPLDIHWAPLHRRWLIIRLGGGK